MNPQTYIALFGWPLVCLACFSAMAPRRAVLVSYLGAWLFLPMFTINLPGVPPYGKFTAAAIGALLGMAIFDSKRLGQFRPSWIDLPMLIWCIVPFFSSVANGLGAYDGVSGMIHAIVPWGIPYLLGRLYLRSVDDVREAAIAMFLAALLYVPFALYEVRMSPQLHSMVYGFVQHEWHQFMRGGGFRPIVFMQHPLAVSGFLALAISCGWWLWRTRAMPRFMGLNTGWWLFGLVCALVLCKSMNGFGLALLGIGVFGALKVWKSRYIMQGLVLLPALYMGGTIVGLDPGGYLLAAAEKLAPARAGSLEQRLYSENQVVAGTLHQPLFGSGRWKESLEHAKDSAQAGRVVIPDGYWAIVFGSKGLVGLGAYIAIFLAPVLLLIRNVPPRQWVGPAWGGVAAVIVVVILFQLDCIMNAMLTPYMPLMLGGLSSRALVPLTRPAARRRRADAARTTANTEPALGPQ